MVCMFYLRIYLPGHLLCFFKFVKEGLLRGFLRLSKGYSIFGRRTGRGHPFEPFFVGTVIYMPCFKGTSSVDFVVFEKDFREWLYRFIY